MKKYTKPAVNVVELTVKESLSALPNNIKGVAAKTAAINNLDAIITTYSNGGGNSFTKTPIAG